MSEANPRAHARARARKRATDEHGLTRMINAERVARVQSMKNHHHYLARRKPADYSDEFYTPQRVTSALGKFNLDPCAGPTTQHGAVNYRRPDDDGLVLNWFGRVWLNPPYSNIYEWSAKFQEHANGIILVSARCETGWFQRLASAASGLLLMKGRLRFDRPGLPGAGPTVGSVLIAYGKENANALRICDLAGVYVQLGRRRTK